MDMDDPAEVGRRIAAARGYAGGTIESFAARLGISAPTLRNYERGELGNYASSPAKRRVLLDQVREAADAPAEIVGLSELGEGDAAEILRRLEELETTTLPALATQLRAEVARELETLRGRRTKQRPGESPGRATEG